MRLRFLHSSLFALVAVAASGCQSTSDPPVAEWSREALADGADAPGRGATNRVSAARGRVGAESIVGSGRFIGDAVARRKDDARDEKDGVTLNLANLPIAQAAKIVLGDIVGVDYVVDPRIDGKVTVHTARPVKKSVAIELFQSALRVSGAAVVENDGVYKIVPLDQAAAGAALSVAPQPLDTERLGSGARVVRLRYVSASELKRVLEPITRQGAVVRADDQRRTLTLTGSAQEIAALEDAIALFDVDTMRGMSFAVVPVTSADPDALAEDLRKVFGSEREGPMNGMIQFVGNKHLSAILAITPQPGYLARARAWIERLDARAQGVQKQFFSYRVQNRPAKELVQVVGSMFGRDAGVAKSNDVSPRFGSSTLSSSGGQSTSSSGSSAFGSSGLGSSGLGSSSAGSSSGQLGAISPLGSGGSGAFGGSSIGGGAGSGSGANGASSANSAQDQTSAGSSLGEDSRFKIAVDEAKNAIVVMATPEDYKRLLRVIEKLDVLPNQVFIEATIAEVSLNDDLHFGVRWFLQKNSSMSGFSNGDAGTPAANDALGNNLLGAAVGAAFPGFAYAFRAASAQVTLNALNQITKVNIISTPSLTVLDNRQAVLQVGDQVPVTTLSGATAQGGVTTFNSVNYRDTGVILAITPHINESGRVMLELEQEVSNVAPGTSTTSTTPTIQQRRVKTQVVVNDAESLMLGGLIQDSRTRGSSQVPVLGDVPFFGNAFKDKTDSAGKTELLIMITPHVVRTLGEARDITDEYKRKLLHISTRAKVRPHNIEGTARRVLLDE
ncbi:Type+3+secretion+system+secretin [Methylocapsa aurea]|uniref:type II secretion system secretin GspD n=1 Tax=Methylocapsa aurea TaxID=663610 RepID=UPI003D187C69